MNNKKIKITIKKIGIKSEKWKNKSGSNWRKF
jgi:hypothetical protein